MDTRRALDSTSAIRRRVVESGGALEPDFGGAAQAPVAQKSGSATVPGGAPSAHLGTRQRSWSDTTGAPSSRGCRPAGGARRPRAGPGCRPVRRMERCGRLLAVSDSAPGRSRGAAYYRGRSLRSPSLTAPIEACSTRSSPAPIIGREGLLRLLALVERWSAAERARREGGGSSCPPSPWSPPTADQPGTSDLGAVAAVQPAAVGLAAERGVGPAAGEAERSDRGGRP